MCDSGCSHELSKSVCVGGCRDAYTHLFMWRLKIDDDVCSLFSLFRQSIPLSLDMDNLVRLANQLVLSGPNTQTNEFHRIDHY